MKRIECAACGNELESAPTVYVQSEDGYESFACCSAECVALMQEHESPPVEPQRHCVIEGGSIEDLHGRGDGAYDLLDVEGTPDAIGKAIAEALRECDLYSGSRGLLIADRNGDLYLNLRIKISASKPEPE